MPSMHTIETRRHLEDAATFATQAKAVRPEDALEPIRKAMNHLERAEHLILDLINQRAAVMCSPADPYQTQKDFSDSEV